MPLLQLLRPTLPILIGASLMLSLSMGLRQSLGIFLQPLTHDVGISVSDFTLAIAVQNLAWGFLQPLAGALTVRFGFRTIMMAGAVFYVAGLSLMAGAQGFLSIMLGAGVLIGIAGCLLTFANGTPPATPTFGAIWSVLYLAIAIASGLRDLSSILVFAAAFTTIPIILEPLNLSPNFVSGTIIVCALISMLLPAFEAKKIETASKSETVAPC